MFLYPNRKYQLYSYLILITIAKKKEISTWDFVRCSNILFFNNWIIFHTSQQLRRTLKTRFYLGVFFCMWRVCLNHICMYFQTPNYPDIVHWPIWCFWCQMLIIVNILYNLVSFPIKHKNITHFMILNK